MVYWKNSIIEEVLVGKKASLMNLVINNRINKKKLNKIYIDIDKMIFFFFCFIKLLKLLLFPLKHILLILKYNILSDINSRRKLLTFKEYFTNILAKILKPIFSKKYND